MKNSLTESADNDKASRMKRNTLWRVVLPLVRFYSPSTSAAEQDVVMAAAAILRDKGFTFEEIAKALVILRPEPWHRITAKQLAQYERYKTLSADPWAVLTKLIGVEAANRFKHYLQNASSPAMADTKKGVEPC